MDQHELKLRNALYPILADCGIPLDNIAITNSDNDNGKNNGNGTRRKLVVINGGEIKDIAKMKKLVKMMEELMERNEL